MHAATHVGQVAVAAHTSPCQPMNIFVATERNAKLRYEGYKKLSEM